MKEVIIRLRKVGAVKCCEKHGLWCLSLAAMGAGADWRCHFRRFTVIQVVVRKSVG